MIAASAGRGAPDEALAVKVTLAPQVPAAKLARFAGCGYFTDPETDNKSQMDRDGAESAYASAPVFPGGAAGLVSTVDDYLIFARMLLNGGVHGNQRLVSEATVQEMTRDHLTPAQKAVSTFFPGFFDTNGWGYGVAVSTAPDAICAAGALRLGRRLRDSLVQ